MLRYLRWAVLPTTMIALAGCSGASMSMDAAQRLEGSGDWQGALSEYDAAVKAKPGSVDAHRGRGRCLIKMNQAKEGEQAFRDAVNADKRSVLAKVELANVLEARQDYMEAKIQLDDAYVYDSKNVAVIEGQAVNFDDQHDFEHAVSKYKEALTIEPNNIDLHTKLAHTYGLMNKFDEAKKELAEVDKIKLQPKKP